MPNTATPAFVTGLADLAPGYRALLCDVWGVVHDGARAHMGAADALARYRADGGAVILITNAPRPKEGVLRLLDSFGVPRDSFDDIITSGVVARDVLAARAGARVFHVGPDRDLPVYEGLPNAFASESDCDLISCTGLFDDETETPDDYHDRLMAWQKRGLPMLCVNPDVVVQRGDRLIWCAGALAERYREMGGETIVVGKPYAPIYETALAHAATVLGAPLDRSAVLAIGDGIDTDVRGAVGQEIDVLFVTGGIHGGIFGEPGKPDTAKVHTFLATAGLGARALIDRLVWQGGS